MTTPLIERQRGFGKPHIFKSNGKWCVLCFSDGNQWGGVYPTFGDLREALR